MKKTISFKIEVVCALLCTVCLVCGFLCSLASAFNFVKADETTMTASLNVGKDMSLLFTAEVPTDATDVSMNFQWKGLADYNNTYDTNSKFYKDNGDGTVTFTYKGITPQNLGKEVTAKLTYEVNGTPKTNSITMSVKEYCERLLSSDQATLNVTDKAFAQIKKLAVDILNFGAQAQIYKNVDTSSLINADKTGGSSFDEFSDLLANKKVTIGESVTKWSRGVSFNYNVEPLVAFKLADTVTVGALSSKIFVNDEEVLATTPSFDGESYRVKYSNFNILDIDKVYTIKVYNDNVEIGSFTDSISSLVYNQKDKTDNTANLLKTCYTYGKSIALYISALSDDTDYDSFTFAPISDTQCSVTAYTGTSLTPVIPNTDLSGRKVVSIDKGVFASKAITEVTIPDTVTSLAKLLRQTTALCSIMTERIAFYWVMTGNKKI